MVFNKICCEVVELSKLAHNEKYRIFVHMVINDLWVPYQGISECDEYLPGPQGRPWINPVT
jgi:hypothetical protein